MIAGVVVEELDVHEDKRGRLAEILRRDDDYYEPFGQAYYITFNPGHSRADHYHREKIEFFCCIAGKITATLRDLREGDDEEDGQTEEVVLAGEAPAVVKIPPGVHHTFTNEGDEPAIVVCVANQVHDPDNPDTYRA